MAKAGYAYVIKIGETGMYKLGHSDDPDRRIQQHHTMATEELSWYAQV